MLYTVFMLYPLANTIYWSFIKWVGTRPLGLAGIDNYTAVFTNYPFSEQLRPAAEHNVVFFLATMVMQNGFGLLLAVLLRGVGRSRSILQAAYVLPFMLSPLIIGYLWSLLLNPIFGPVQGALAAIGLDSLYAPWLGQQSTALIAMAGINAWQSIGLPMLLFYAALSAIPADIIEAARCDGATGRQVFRWVSLPLIMPAVVTVSLLTFIWSVNVFDLPYAVGGPNGSPGGAIDVLGLLFYRVAFTGSSNAVGTSSAMAVMLFLVVLAASSMFMLVRRRLGSAE